MIGLERAWPCDAVSPSGQPCANTTTESRPHGPEHYTDGWPLRKDGEPDRRYRYPVGPVERWSDAGGES